MISFSGRTSELLLLLPHIPQTVPIIAITSHAHPATCPLLSFHHPDMGILLPAPIHENEESSLGVSAPTSSTTVALSLGDALAIAAARRIHTSSDRGPAEVFKSLHPGGAIGAAAAAAAAATNPSTATTPMSMSAFSFNSSGYLETRPALSSTSSDQDEHRPLLLTDCISTPPVPLHHIPIVSAPAGTRLLDVLLTAIQHPDAKSWVFLSDNEVVPPRHTRSLCRSGNVDLHVSEFAGLPFAIHRKDWVHVSVSSTVDEVRARLKRLGPDSSAVVAVVKESSSDVLGVLEGGDFW